MDLDFLDFFLEGKMCLITELIEYDFFQEIYNVHISNANNVDPNGAIGINGLKTIFKCNV